MERYKEYKDSGIFWEPCIPNYWRVTRLKNILSKLDRTRTPNDELLVCSNSGEVKKRGDNKLGLVADSDEIYQGVKSGDLLIHGMDTWHGAIAVSKLDGMCTPVVHVCDSSQEKEFVALYLRNMASQKIFKLISNGVRQNTSDFRSWSKLGCIPIAIPPLPEQKKIVSYIESKTSKIDEYIAEKEKEVQLLSELKEAEIAKVVTQGLNPNVKMKDSGISWIGMIPEHWKQYRFATICKEKSICNCVNEELLSVYLDRGVIRFTDDSNKRTNPTSKDLSKYQLVEVGDFVLNNQQAWRGSVGVSNYRGIVSPAYFIFSLSPIIDKDFANYLFRSKSCVAYYFICSKGIGSIQRNLDWSTLKQKKIALPSIDEQRAIVAYINEKTAKMESLITDLQAEIEHLKEYKQRLIADCVTGQVKVI